MIVCARVGSGLEKLTAIFSGKNRIIVCRYSVSGYLASALITNVGLNRLLQHTGVADYLSFDHFKGITASGCLRQPVLY
ncbi:hypothetical protein [Endozoicomonas sp. YOMI1]|uniref:hypothetical protein n=1 Tax=Endozoicomonas sp. YOMI1 TaxID=2828739 RepID=UPI0021474A73|nr:hypothetical protein [Endozoicomonas sp. YOMI1]